MAEAAQKMNPLPPPSSKFRHASCVDDNLSTKIENRYTDFVGQAWNQNWVDDFSSSASAKYFAAHNSGSNILVVQLGKPGRKKQGPCAKYHGGKGKVTVSRWSPHNHGLLASGDENGHVLINYFEDSLFDDETGLMKEDVKEAMTEIDTGLHKKISSIAWHPCIKNLLAVGGGEGDGEFLVKFFDTDTGAEVCSPISSNKQSVSLDWSWDSKHVAFCDKTNKGHTCFVYNLKGANGPEKVGEIRTDYIRSSCFFMNDAVDHDDHHVRSCKYICVIGSSGARSKTYLDVYTYTGDKVGSFNFSGTEKVFATWDAGRNFVWIFIKGSGQMRGLHWEAKKKTFKVNCHHSEHGRRLKGGAWVHQSGCDVNNYCIAMLMGLEGGKTGEIWPFRFIVPRRKKGEFEAQLYPDIVSLNQDMTAAEWEKAETVPSGPKMASCDPGKTEEAQVFVKKIPYGELAKMVEEYEAFIMAKLNEGAFDKSALPASLQAKLEEEA